MIRTTVLNMIESLMICFSLKRKRKGESRKKGKRCNGKGKDKGRKNNRKKGEENKKRKEEGGLCLKIKRKGLI